MLDTSSCQARICAKIWLDEKLCSKIVQIRSIHAVWSFRYNNIYIHVELIPSLIGDRVVIYCISFTESFGVEQYFVQSEPRTLQYLYRYTIPSWSDHWVVSTFSSRDITVSIMIIKYRCHKKRFLFLNTYKNFFLILFIFLYSTDGHMIFVGYATINDFIHFMTLTCMYNFWTNNSLK